MSDTPPSPYTGHQDERVTRFACPQCDADLTFAPDVRGLACSHCGYRQPMETPAVDRSAGEAGFSPAAIQEMTVGWRMDTQEVACQRCQGKVILPPGALTQKCPFCGSYQIIQAGGDQARMRPHYLIPFSITLEQCQAKAREWLGDNWMTPHDLKQIAGMGDFRPLYAPFWTFDAQTSADWRAEVGIDQQERFFDNATRQWQTRTVTRWEWRSGHVDVTVDDLLVAGTQHLQDAFLGEMAMYDFGRLADYDPRFLAGAQAQAYEIALAEAWQKGQKLIQARTENAGRGQVGGGQVRNFSLSNYRLFNEKWRYVLLPLYVSVYNYQGKPFQMLVNGQSGRIGGQRPVVWRRVWFWALMPLLLSLLFLLASLTIISSDGVMVAAFIASFIALFWLIATLTTARRTESAAIQARELNWNEPA